MAGYSGKPLREKLGIKAGFEMCLAAPPDGYIKLLEPLPQGVQVSARISKETDLVQVFASQRSALAKALSEYRQRLKPTAVVWVSWPKKSARVPTDITEDTVRELALPLGFVDIKVCAVSEVWSGLKLVVRKDLR